LAKFQKEILIEVKQQSIEEHSVFIYFLVFDFC